MFIKTRDTVKTQTVLSKSGMKNGETPIMTHIAGLSFNSRMKNEEVADLIRKLMCYELGLLDTTCCGDTSSSVLPRKT